MRNLLMPALMLTATLSLVACGGGSSVSGGSGSGGGGTPPLVNPPLPAAALPANPQAFFAANALKMRQSQLLTQTGAAQTLTFSGATALTFPVGSVVDIAGNIYTGPVVVSVIEIRSKSDMILSNVMTITEDTRMAAGNMFFLDLKTLAGVALNVNPDKPLSVAVPATHKPKEILSTSVGGGNPNFGRNALGPNIGPKGVPVNPGVFNGRGAPNAGCTKTYSTTAIGIPNPPLTAGDSNVNWCPLFALIDTQSVPGFNVFDVYSKGWNAALAYPHPTGGGLFVSFTPINDANTMVFLSVRGSSSVVALHTTNGPYQRKGTANTLPLWADVDVVAITFDNGKQYLAHETVKVTYNTPVPLTFVQASTNDITTYLATLN